MVVLVLIPGVGVLMNRMLAQPIPTPQRECGFHKQERSGAVWAVRRFNRESLTVVLSTDEGQGDALAFLHPCAPSLCYLLVQGISTNGSARASPSRRPALDSNPRCRPPMYLISACIHTSLTKICST